MDNNTESPNRKANPVEPPKEMYSAVLAATQEQVRFADSKAGFVAALHALLFGFIASDFKALRAAYDTVDKAPILWVSVVLVTLYVIAALISLAKVVRVVLPQLGKSAPESMVFFEHIAQRYKGRHRQYVEDTAGITDAEWAEHLGTQVVEVSKIASAKHKQVRVAANSTACAFLLWVCALFTIGLIPPPAS